MVSEEDKQFLRDTVVGATPKELLKYIEAMFDEAPGSVAAFKFLFLTLAGVIDDSTASKLRNDNQTSKHD